MESILGKVGEHGTALWRHLGNGDSKQATEKPLGWFYSAQI